MPSGVPSMTRTPFTDSDDRELVAFLAVHHPSKEGRMGNAVYKLLTEQPNRWPWGKRHTWMSWRERYKNNEARFDHHIKAFQYKNKLSRQPVPVGFGAMSVDGMEDLNDFGTDEEEENRRAQQKRAARVDSDSDDLDDLDEELVSTQSGDGSKAIAAPKHPASKRKRVSDTNDRTSKRSRVTEDGGSDKMQGGNHTGGEEGEVMDQDSQGEETFEIEQNLLHLSDEDSLITPRRSQEGATPKRPVQTPRSGGSAASTSKDRRTSRHREPVHRPHSPKNPPSSPFSTVDLDESDTDSPVVPKPVRKRTLPKIVESAFGRNEQSAPVRSSQTRADSSPDFNLLVERRAARKASKNLEVPSTGELQRDSPELGPSSSSTSRHGSVEPRLLSPPSQPTPRLRPGSPSTTIDATEKKMIEAREELSKLALKFRDRFQRSPPGSKSPSTRMNVDKTHLSDESTSTHPFDETTHPFDESTHAFDEITRPFDDSQTQTQEKHPFDQDFRAPTQELHPFDGSTQQPPDSTLDGQSQRSGLEVRAPNTPMGDSPLPPTPGSSKRRTTGLLTMSLLESRKSRISSIDRLRPGLLPSSNHPPRSSQDLSTNELPTPGSSSRGLKTSTPITTSRSAVWSSRSPGDDGPILSPRRTRAGGVSPDEGRRRSTATQELRELLENSPRTRRTRTPGNVDTERKTIVKSETTTPGYHLRSKSMTNDDPFSSPAGLRLSSPHPQADATIPDSEQESPLALRTTFQSGLNATIKSRQVRREAVQHKNRRVHDPEQSNPSRSLGSTTAAATSSTLRKSKVVVESSVQADMEEDVDESQTYDIERDLYDVTSTPMMDLSFRPPRRIPPTYRGHSHTHHRTSSFTANSRDHEHERELEADGHKSLRYRSPEAERDVQDDRDRRRDSRRLSGVSFGSPIAASSPPNARRNGHGQSRDRQDKNTTNTSFSPRTSIGSSVSTTSPAIGIMAGPLSLGFAPSEMDMYLGIRIACEKIAKSHGFQSDAVLRVYQEVKDLRKTEEIVIGMKRAAEKDAIERIMKAREKTERRRTSGRFGEGSSYWDRDGGQTRTSRRSYDLRDEDEEEDDGEGATDRSIIYEEDEDDPDSPMKVEHLSHRGKRSSTSSTSALRQGGKYPQPSRASTITTRRRERDQVRNRESSTEYHPPTPTRANLWERLSRPGKHPEAALLGESLRASLPMPRYEAVDRE